jgi:hypothetical protein
MRKPAAFLAAVGAVVLLTASSCEQKDPCRNIDKPTQAETQIAADHPEWEIEVEGENEAECVLTRSGNWSDETDE